VGIVKPTKQELEDLYWKEELSTMEIAKILHVGQSTVYKWMREYGIPRGKNFKMKKWSKEEIEKLKKVYPVSSRAEVEAQFPDRSWDSIRWMAKVLGLKLGHRRDNYWREEELRFLKKNYDKMTDKEIAQKLGRPTSAIQNKRRELGLMKRIEDVTKPSRLLNLSEIEKAYLAGLIDGDGSIFLSYYQARGKKGIHSRISCAISARSANKEFAEEIMQMMGGEVKEVGKDYYEVLISRYADILQLLELILPYLRLKRKQAEIMIEFCKERLKYLKYRRNAPYTPRCFKLADMMLALNNKPMKERKWK